MAVSNIKAVFQCDLQRVWRVITSLENYSWHSDLDKIEIINDTQFLEYTKDGYITMFTVTSKVDGERWEFDMENDNIQGHWTGIFTYDGMQTQLDFTENVTAKKIFMKPFVKPYLKRQQATYISDLSRALDSENE